MRSVLIPLTILASFAAAAADNDHSGPRSLDQIRHRPVQQLPAANIRVDVNMALVPVTVMDAMGRNITGLGRENFRVFDGSEPRPIVAFSREDQPVSVGIIFDCSRSMSDKFVTAREAPAELFRHLNGGDESFLITVSTAPQLRQTFTSNFQDIQNSLLFTNPDGSTPLLDGILLGLAQIKKAHNARKALIVVSDGGDNNSRYTLSELTRIAVESDTQIFAIGLHSDPRTPEEAEGPALLQRITAATGGVNFLIQNVESLGAVMDKIGIALHNQYVLGYYPPQRACDGKYRKIRVELMVPSSAPHLQIYARSGYYAPGK